MQDGILDLLEARFKAVSYELRERIQSIQTESVLRDLHRQSALAPDLPSFIAQLPR